MMGEPAANGGSTLSSCALWSANHLSEPLQLRSSSHSPSGATMQARQRVRERLLNGGIAGPLPACRCLVVIT